MKKLLLVSCLLFTPSVFAADQPCTVNFAFLDSVWGVKPLPTWTVNITDNTPNLVDQFDPQHNELVGAPILWTGLYSDIQKMKDNTLIINMANCTNNTQFGLFAHENVKALAAGGQNSAAAEGQASSNAAGMQAQGIQAFNATFLSGMTHCVGDMGLSNISTITITVGNPSSAGQAPNPKLGFVWGGAVNAPSATGFTKQALGVTCQAPVTEESNTGN